MGALVAAVNKTGENVVPSVATMLKELSHRGKDAHGIATLHSATTAKTIEKLAIQNWCSSIAVGHNLFRILPRDQPQPVQNHDFTVVFEGRLFPPEIVAPVFRWRDTSGTDRWTLHVAFGDGGQAMDVNVDAKRWTPSEDDWNEIKRRSV